MADKDTSDEATVEVAPKSKRKLVIIAAAAVLLVSAGGGAGWHFFLRDKGAAPKQEVVAPKPMAFIEVPEILVNMAGNPGDRVQYLKVKVVLEAKDAAQVALIAPSMPRITDIMQTYMRELRANDLNGSIGMFRLKEELTRRVNLAIAPSQVNAVLFKEIFIQ